MANLKLIVLVFAIILGYNLYDNFDPETLRGKRVVVTGASKGIGEHMAYHYAAMGARIVITARSEGRLQQVIAKCRELGDPNGDYHYVVADMSDMASTELVIKTAVIKLGGIDYLVLNHIFDTPINHWTGHSSNLTKMQQVMDINFKSYVHLASHGQPYLEQSHGSLVVVSSVAGKIPQPFLTSYSASKFALDGFFGALRGELVMRKKDVSVTLCVIGLIRTENAVKNLRNFGAHFVLDTLPEAYPTDAAYAIIRGGALRQREMHFPYAEARLTTIFRDWFPGIIQSIIIYLYS